MIKYKVWLPSLDGLVYEKVLASSAKELSLKSKSKKMIYMPKTPTRPFAVGEMVLKIKG